MAGISASGFTIKRYDEILTDLVASEQSSISASISTKDDELLGQLNKIVSNAITELWELAESVNSNFDPDKAEGKNLDDLASLIGIARFTADASDGIQVFVGDEGTTIPAGSVFSNPISGDTFKSLSQLDLVTSNCRSTKYSVKTLSNSTAYTLTANTTDYTFTSDASATELEILNGINALITADTSKTWTGTVDAGALQISIETSDTSNISVSSTTLIGADEVTVETRLESTVTGALVVPINSITTVISPITGITSTTNEVAYDLGRSLETDEELRLRFTLSRAVNGLSTPEAIKALLLETDGVTSASVFENDTSVVDGEGRPAKSFEALVEGGTDADVGLAIWTSKPAGIETFGTTTEVILDSGGDSRSMKFTRPDPIHLALKVTYSLYSEEDFPTLGEDVISQTVVDTTLALPVDEDVIVTRYYGDIYRDVEGIDTLTVEYEVLAASGDAPTGTWLTTKLAIAYNERASCALQDVTIVAI